MRLALKGNVQHFAYMMNKGQNMPASQKGVSDGERIELR